MTMPDVRQMLDKLEEIRLAVLDMSKVVARMEGYTPTDVPPMKKELAQFVYNMNCPTQYEEEK